MSSVKLTDPKNVGKQYDLQNICYLQNYFF